ncbi:MAG: TVP38/TMEM64 family protein [Clostridia bacterium]|nr:TVP38/TMEM64 family protein [Clostridia bacterium]
MKKDTRPQKIIKIISLTAVIGLLLFFSYLLYRLIADKEAFEAWLTQYGEMSRLIYIAIVALQVILALIPGEVLEIAGGYIFGILEGTFLNLLGATIGSMLVFLLVRKFGKPLVSAFFSEEKISKLRFLQDSKKRDLLLMLIFMLPGTPKDLLCYFAGLTNIKTSLWLLICSLGRLPSVITSTIGGSAIENESYLVAVIAFAAAAAVSLLGILIYHRISEKKK